VTIVVNPQPATKASDENPNVRGEEFTISILAQIVCYGAVIA
jgi:hypothetical protein